MIISRLCPSDQLILARRLLAREGFQPLAGASVETADEFLREADGALVKFDSRSLLFRAKGTGQMNGTLGFFFRFYKFERCPEVGTGVLVDSELTKGLKETPTLKIRSLTLNGYRGFKDARLSFGLAGSTIFIGNNGSGKSTLLDAVATSLSWLSRRIANENSQGRKPAQDDIHNDSEFATIRTEALYRGRGFTWDVTEKRKGSPSRVSSHFRELSLVVQDQQLEYRSKVIPTNFPTLVYYPVNRAVLDVPKRIKKKHHFEPLETYEDALVAGGRDFRFFFEWFRERENLENEIIRDEKSFLDRELEAVRKAVADFTGLTQLRIRRRPKQRMMAVKDGRELSVQQLSDGEKCLLALVGDLARRLALANPEMEDPLLGCGVVLIDEIELHLHPNWQREIVKKLETTFPNCQFLLSTHSPIVLSQVPKESVRILKNFQVIENQSPVEGREANSILAEVMGVPIFPDGTQQRIDEIDSLIDSAKYQEARECLKALSEKLGAHDPVIVSHQSSIDFLEADIFRD